VAAAFLRPPISQDLDDPFALDAPIPNEKDVTTERCRGRINITSASPPSTRWRRFVDACAAN
jgi:hypothetical protein